MRIIGYVFLAGCLFAGSSTEFRGRIIEGGFKSYDGLIVEFSNLQDHAMRERVDVSPDGTFDFRLIPEGDYQVRVLTLYGNEVTNTIVSIGPTSLPFEIRMPEPKLQQPGSGTISIQQLSHPPSKQVLKLLDSGHRLIEDKHWDDAAARFREAAREDPDCAQAHADLGLSLAKMEKWDDAVLAYRKAVSLEPRSSVLHSNLSAVLASSGRLDEAENEASEALKLYPRNARAHYVLAGILIRKPGHVSEVVSHLVAAEDVVPSAKAAVEKLCATNRVDSCP